ncbi:MAG: putative bifunctional diguanylate cyclase/phosphodiesterase [Burkholderiales bacterium]
MNNAEILDRVLLVDDDGVTRLMVRRALERRGMAVMEADCGEQGLAMVDTQRPDIVVLDAMMPGMDGFATCVEMRLHPASQHIPILILTSLDDDKSIAMAYEAGATDFYVKSTQTTLLVERVRYLLRAGRLNKELTKSQGHLAKAQRLARLGSFEWRPQERRITVSDECFRILAITSPPGELSEELFFGQFAGPQPSAIRDAMFAELRDERIFCGDFEIVAAKDLLRHIQIEAEAEFDTEGEIAVVHGTVQDITERRQAEEQVRRLANYDTLTGLPNRNLFQQRFERALAAARRGKGQLAVMFVDLDRFKVVNDTLGHRAGDTLLREVAARLNRCVRGGDSVTRFGEDDGSSSVARLGGDEFIVLLTALKQVDDAAKVADRMLEALREPLVVEGQEIWISASVGIASYPKDGETAETLLMRADAAMYSAKAHGRDGHKVYTPSLDSRSLDQFRLETDLRKALEREELRLHYQPIINVTTGKIVGTEVLMRWQRGDKLVPPGDFIPLAEDTGLIIPMGEWALAEACKRVQQWHAQGLDPIYVGVNLPGSHFQRRDLVQLVGDIIDKTGFDPRCLHIEITETVLMKAVDQILPIFNALRELGIHFAIDDFGTGYSSLAYLKRLPIHTLKIDRSFIKDIAVDSDDEVIVSAIIGLARSLNLSVVAEGVETAAQMAFLNMFSSTLMQGFLFSRPVPEQQFEELLRQTSGIDFRMDWLAQDKNKVIHLFNTDRKAPALAGSNN